MYILNDYTVDFFWDTETIFDLASQSSGVAARGVNTKEGVDIMSLVITESDKEFVLRELFPIMNKLYDFFQDITPISSKGLYISMPDRVMTVPASGFDISINRDSYGKLVGRESRLEIINLLSQDFIVSSIIERWCSAKGLTHESERLTKSLEETSIRLKKDIKYLKKRNSSVSFT